MLSVVYVVSYLAMGVPAMIGGFMVTHGAGLMPTARGYGAAVTLLAALALAATLLPGKRKG